jgi:glucose-1-phosphate thymidylyltransferase
VNGIILAGGLGTRFHPVTKVVNKHLLDVFDEPMVHYPIHTLAQAGVREIVLVTGAEIDQFKSLLGDGSHLGVSITYGQQIGELGIAHALGIAETLTTADKLVVVLGDNIFQEDLSPYVDSFKAQDSGARLLLKRVAPEDAMRFGVAMMEAGLLKGIVEKPKEAIGDLVVSGCYMYDRRVFEIIKGLKLSDRNEYEITDVNNDYIDRGEMKVDVLKGWWTDAGTPPSKLKASILVALNKGVTFHA